MLNNIDNQQHAKHHIDAAMILAAGYGTRMLPFTLDCPKPLLPFCHQTIIDYIIACIKNAHINTLIINTHYLADHIEKHIVQQKHYPINQIKLIYEKKLLDSGGGVLNAQPVFEQAINHQKNLEQTCCLLANADSIWHPLLGKDGPIQYLQRAWQPNKMDMLLLLCNGNDDAVGYNETSTPRGDFILPENINFGQLQRAQSPNHSNNLLAYAGLALLSGRVFAKLNAISQRYKSKVFSLNLLFDDLIAHNRLYGSTFLPKNKKTKCWFHLGTPTALAQSQKLIESNPDIYNIYV